MKSYRKIYKEFHGKIPIDENGVVFDIHHIDGDRKNNSIENLLALSIDDHYKVHFQQGDYTACLLILNRLGKLEDSDRVLSSRWMKENNPSLKTKGTSNHPLYHKTIVIDRKG